MLSHAMLLLRWTNKSLGSINVWEGNIFSLCHYAVIKPINKTLEQKENQEHINMRLANIN